jgi:hypothetical protein
MRVYVQVIVAHRFVRPRFGIRVMISLL